jgi:hypothetical protein
MPRLRLALDAAIGEKEGSMKATDTIQWKKDADAALAEARSTGKPVLLDFSAAPM